MKDIIRECDVILQTTGQVVLNTDTMKIIKPKNSSKTMLSQLNDYIIPNTAIKKDR